MCANPGLGISKKGVYICHFVSLSVVIIRPIYLIVVHITVTFVLQVQSALLKYYY